MHRTTVMLPDDLKQRALEVARERGISFGALVREALGARLERQPAGATEDPFFADHEVFRGPTPADLAARHDRYLYGG